jgi:NADPH:quinone reductase-like Zn-dependent oxidoreductase
LGCDFSGVVEALGPGVAEFFPGQSVFGYSCSAGTFAEMTVAPVNSVVLKPASMDDIEAAATPLCALTAWQALHEAANLQTGQSILIHGGAGGVGMFAVQLALRQDARVIATGSGRGLSFLGRIGCHELIDHHAVRFENVVKNMDVVLDLIGGETQERSWKVLKPGGRLVSTVSEPSQERARLCGVRATKIQTHMRADHLCLMGDMIANGEIKVIVEKVLPLSRAPEALAMSQRGHVHGKIVLTLRNHDAAHSEVHQTAVEKYHSCPVLVV